MNFHSASRWLASSYTCFPALASHNNWDLHLAQLTLCVAWHSRSNKQMMKLHYNQDSESCVLQTQSFLMNYEHMSTSLTHMDASDTFLVFLVCPSCVSDCFLVTPPHRFIIKMNNILVGALVSPSCTDLTLMTKALVITWLLLQNILPLCLHTWKLLLLWIQKKWKYAFVLSEAVDISQIVGLL